MNITTLKPLAEFRSNPEKVKALRQALDLDIMREAMSILERVAPHHEGVVNRASETHNNVLLGNILGYTLRGDRLLDLATHIYVMPIIIEDYKDEN